jgi:O-succinylbenzoic acid--CoA ligase
MDALMLNGVSYPMHELGDACALPELTDYERQVLQFVQQWRSGQETFTVYTSGSTGRPKAIQLSRAQMATSARLTVQALGLQPGDRALVCVSAEFIAGIMMLVRGLEFGLPLTVVEPVSRPLANLAPDPPFEFTAMVPLQLQATLQGSPHERAMLDRMKGVLIGGAVVSMALEQQMQPITAPLYHTYGMTETVSHIALRRLNGPQRSDRFVPFEGVKLADGTFQWIGRIDNVINSGGVKVQIETVERALEAWLLREQGGIYADRRFFVGPIDHSRLGQAVAAVIEGEPFGGGDTLSPGLETAMRNDLQQSLSRYETPRHFFFVSKLLETPTGKIDRRANLERIAILYPQS